MPLTMSLTVSTTQTRHIIPSSQRSPVVQLQPVAMPASPSPDHDTSPFHQCRHLVFDFTLIGEDGLARNPTDDEFEILFNALPSSISVGVAGPFLTARFAELPPKPWPVSVAGLPFYVASDMFDLPPIFGRPGRIRRHELGHLDAQRTSTPELFDAMIHFFESENISIYEVAWANRFWTVTVDDTTDISSLPGKMCQVAVMYVTKKADTLTEAAFRTKKPGPFVRDDTQYSPIRPGVILASKSLSTTSGILVKDEKGAMYMTASSHGFPEGETDVYHPKIDGQIIGHVVRRFPDTDIALVELNDDIHFENHTFQSPEEPAGVLLKGIKDPHKMLACEFLTMDNGFVGTTDALFLKVAKERFQPSDRAEHLWVTKLWTWVGQNPDKLPVAGSCGSALYDGDGNVVAFFRYYGDDGTGVGVAAQELANEGYSLVSV